MTEQTSNPGITFWVVKCINKGNFASANIRIRLSPHYTNDWTSFPRNNSNIAVVINTSFVCDSNVISSPREVRNCLFKLCDARPTEYQYKHRSRWAFN